MRPITLALNEVGTNNALGTFVDNITITDSDGFGVWENEAGAEVATLSVTDPDDGDTQTYTVSDTRFEVVELDGQMVLKLKDGESLDYESEQSVNVTVTVEDSQGATDSQTLTVYVGDVNDAPVALDSSVSTGEDASISGTLAATDADGDDITYSLNTGTASEGTITVNADGSYSFDPGTDFDDLAADESREVSFTYNAEDENGSTDTGTVTITVNGANDAPTDIANFKCQYRRE